MVRFLLFRFLPRRLLPVLTILEVIWLVRRLREWWLTGTGVESQPSPRRGAGPRLAEAK